MMTLTRAKEEALTHEPPQAHSTTLISAFKQCGLSYKLRSLSCCRLLQACHDYEPSECACISINEVACYRIGRTLTGCADPRIKRWVHPISALELIKPEVVWREGHCDES